jgi:hypothetical protein
MELGGRAIQIGESGAQMFPWKDQGKGYTRQAMYV